MNYIPVLAGRFVGDNVLRSVVYKEVIMDRCTKSKKHHLWQLPGKAYEAERNLAMRGLGGASLGIGFPYYT